MKSENLAPEHRKIADAAIDIVMNSSRVAFLRARGQRSEADGIQIVEQLYGTEVGSGQLAAQLALLGADIRIPAF